MEKHDYIKHSFKDKGKDKLLSLMFKKGSKVIEDNLKTIFNKESEYATFLMPIENQILLEYRVNKKVKDKRIVRYLKNLMENLDKPNNFFESDFEQKLYEEFFDILSINKITEHELKLCLKYILWAIDNRAWMEDSQAYVKWLAYVSNEMDQNEKNKYQLHVKKIGRKLNMPKEDIDMILENDYSRFEFDENDKIEDKSEFFNMSKSEKMKYVLDNYEESPEFFGEYFFELMEEGLIDDAEKLCKTLNEKAPDHPPLEIMLGGIYIEKKNKHLARFHLENALKNLESLEFEDDFVHTTLKDNAEKLLKMVDDI